MMRIVISFGLLVHGLIHILGFTREWLYVSSDKVADQAIPTFTEKGSRTVGALWLLACLLFLLATFAYAFRKDFFWIPAAAGLLLSQSLIIIYWDDARFGTIANILVGLLVVFSFASIRFAKTINDERRSIVQQAVAKEIVVTNESIATLPPIVQKWLQNSGVVGRKNQNVIRISQQGIMRTTPDAGWMPFTAEQVITIDPPAFLWSARVKAAKVFEIVARDKFVDAKGNMLIRGQSLITLANASGSEIDQGTMVRYLAEVCWFPHGAVSDYITWEEIDQQSARAIMQYGENSVSGVFTFDDNGMIRTFEADRYGDFNGERRMEKWLVRSLKTGRYNGIVAPAENEISWKLKDGDFMWLKMEVNSIQ